MPPAGFGATLPPLIQNTPPSYGTDDIAGFVTRAGRMVGFVGFTPRTAKYHGTARTRHNMTTTTTKRAVYLGLLYLTESDYHLDPCVCTDDLSRCGYTTNQLANRHPTSTYR